MKGRLKALSMSVDSIGYIIIFLIFLVVGLIAVGILTSKGTTSMVCNTEMEDAVNSIIYNAKWVQTKYCKFTVNDKCVKYFYVSNTQEGGVSKTEACIEFDSQETNCFDATGIEFNFAELNPGEHCLRLGNNEVSTDSPELCEKLCSG